MIIHLQGFPRTQYPSQALAVAINRVSCHQIAHGRLSLEGYIRQTYLSLGLHINCTQVQTRLLAVNGGKAESQESFGYHGGLRDGCMPRNEI